MNELLITKKKIMSLSIPTIISLSSNNIMGLVSLSIISLLGYKNIAIVGITNIFVKILFYYWCLYVIKSVWKLLKI